MAESDLSPDEARRLRMLAWADQIEGPLDDFLAAARRLADEGRLLPPADAVDTG